MELNMYSILDTAAKAYNTPFCMQNDALAIRAFSHNVNDETTTINKNPEQFSLYHIGVFDDQSGNIKPQEPQHVITAINVHKEARKHDEIEDRLRAIQKTLDKITEVSSYAE